MTPNRNDVALKQLDKQIFGNNVTMLTSPFFLPSLVTQGVTEEDAENGVRW